MERLPKKEKLLKLLKHSGKASNASVIMRISPNMIISQSDAMLLGFNVYHTGKKCRYGHDGWRYTQNNLCLLCARDRYRKSSEKFARDRLNRTRSLLCI